jgi:TolB-like protein/DNA-binding winged helix-turn-helix (wHTH) protein/Tfp pilus assembly protein PilF
MAAKTLSAETVRFGIFELDLRSGEMRRGGVKVKLQDQPFQVLTALLQQPGHLVSREELRQQIWPEDTFVDFDNSLNTAISKLRDALGDSADSPRFIETLPRRGYRFIAPVSGIDGGAATPDKDKGDDGRESLRRFRWIVAVVSLTVLAATLFAFDVFRVRERVLNDVRVLPIQSLAVLPLTNLSGDPAQEYFSDGMTDALTTELAQIGALRVISRTSAMQYKEAKKPLPQIARELNVDAIVEGSVMRSGGRVRVTAQLIRASPEQHLWAKSYESDLPDILSLQSQVARSVADAIRLKLTQQEESRLRQPRVVNPDAHDAYLRGRYHWNRRSLGVRRIGIQGEHANESDLEKARGYFEEAIHIDPQYAPAYSGLADYYSVLPLYTNSNPNDVFPKAKAAVAKALELDDSLAEAHASLAYIRTYYDWDWADAGREFQRALVLNPNDATVHQLYSRYLSSLGRIDEALEEIRRAHLIDPLSMPIRANVGFIYYFGHQYDSAVDELQNILKENQKFWLAHWGLGLAYEQNGMISNAITEFETAAVLSGRSANAIASLGHAYAIAGRRHEADTVLVELENRGKQTNISSYQGALVFVGLGDKDRAFEELEKALGERSTLLGYLRMDPRLDPLRSDPRFADLLRRINFPL